MEENQEENHTLARSGSEDEADQIENDNWLRERVGDEQLQWMKEFMRRGHATRLYEIENQQPEYPPGNNITVEALQAHGSARNAWLLGREKVIQGISNDMQDFRLEERDR